MMCFFSILFMLIFFMLSIQFCLEPRHRHHAYQKKLTDFLCVITYSFI